jgi:hypothetical protein
MIRTRPHKEIAAELEAAGWRVFRSSWRPGEGWYYERHKENYDLYLGPKHKLTPVAPGARRALDLIVMGHPAPRRE